MWKNYKRPDTKAGQVEWSIFCPVESWSLEKKLSVEDAKSLKYGSNILINAKVRFPKELQDQPVQISLWRSNKPILSDDIDDQFVGVGGLQFIEEDYADARGVFYISQPAEALAFDDIAATLLNTETAQHLRRECHLDVIGLLNDWDRTGHLCVTKFSLIVFRQANENINNKHAERT